LGIDLVLMGREVEELLLIFLRSKDFGAHFWPRRNAACSYKELLTNTHHPCKNRDRIFREITTTITQDKKNYRWWYYASPLSLPGAQNIARQAVMHT